MEMFTKTKAVKLKSHIDKYLVADDDQEHTRQSRNGSSRKARWIVELVEGNEEVIRLKSSHGKFLTASNESFLLGMTGKKVLQTIPQNMEDFRVLWQPIKDGFSVKLRAFGGTYLRANGGTPPWRNSVTHDSSYTGSTHNWILWEVEGVEIGEQELVKDYWSMVSSFSSVSNELSGLDIGSPVSEYSAQSPRVLEKKNKRACFTMMLDHESTNMPNIYKVRRVYTKLSIEMSPYHVHELTGPKGEEETSHANEIDNLKQCEFPHSSFSYPLGYVSTIHMKIGTSFCDARPANHGKWPGCWEFFLDQILRVFRRKFIPPI